MSCRIVLLVPCLAASVLADGPGDNNPAKVKPIPPVGISVSKQDRDELTQKLDELGKEIANLSNSPRGPKGIRAELLPDVEILYKAVHDALKYNEFYSPGEVKQAGKFLDEGLSRARQLRSNRVTWNDPNIRRPGMILCAYRSRIDGSVQPYGLVIPASYRSGGPAKFRLDIWLHGRGEKLSELSFLSGCQNGRGQFTPRDAFVLHPYGRYCNAFKLAGEVDVLEAIDDVMKRFRIDEPAWSCAAFRWAGRDAGVWRLTIQAAGLPPARRRLLGNA